MTEVASATRGPLPPTCLLLVPRNGRRPPPQTAGGVGFGKVCCAGANSPLSVRNERGGAGGGAGGGGTVRTQLDVCRSTRSHRVGDARALSPDSLSLVPRDGRRPLPQTAG